MPFDPDLASAIDTIPGQYGVDPDYIRKMAVAESSGNLGAQAATSSAAGPYQIIGSTADSLGISRADRYDPQIATDAISRFTQNNAAGLQRAGYDPTHGNLYLSHFAGLGGARSILGADPGTPVSQVLPASSIAANPFLRNMTAGDVTAWADRKMGGGGPPAVTTPGAANPGMSVGSTAMQGGFGLGGIQAQGAPVAGQAVPPGAPSLAAQPMTAMGPTAPTMMPGRQGAAAPTGYSQLASLLQNAQALQQGIGGLSGALGGGQGQGQRQQGQGQGPGFLETRPAQGGGSVPTIAQARKLFDPSRFYSLLPRGIAR